MPKKRHRKIFDKNASVAALKEAEENRAICRGWDVALTASASILWYQHMFSADDISQMVSDVKLLRENTYSEVDNGSWQEAAYERLTAIKDELGIDTLNWPLDGGLSDSEVLGASLALEMVVCALHDDDYFTVENDELKEFHEEFRRKIFEYSEGDWNLMQERKTLRTEIGVELDW